MTSVLQQAIALEDDFQQLALAEELDDERIAGVLERRNTLHRQLTEEVDQDNTLLNEYQPFFQQAYKNMQLLQKRCETERSDIQEKLITLNTAKKARKAY